MSYFTQKTYKQTSTLEKLLGGASALGHIYTPISGK